MDNKKSWPVVGVFGHYGNENLGDEAIITAVLQNLRKLWPDVEARCFSIVPEDSAQRHQVAAFPIRWRPAPTTQARKDKASSEGPELVSRLSNENKKPSLKDRLKTLPVMGFGIRVLGRLRAAGQQTLQEIAFLGESYRAVKALDLLMITGSNQFLDNFGGPWGFPYTLLKWSVLAKLAGVKVFFVSVGAGPLEARQSRLLVRCALWFADYLSLRDEPSRQLIAGTGSKCRGLVYPDLAHSLDMSAVAPRSTVTASRDAGPRVIGINPMPMYDSRYWCEKDDTKYRAYLDRLTEFSAWLIEAGYEVFFFPTQPKDELVIDDISRALAEKGLQDGAYKKAGDSVYTLMDIIQSADLIVATRFHGTVLSLLSGKPTLSVCYYRKTADLMKDMGQGQYALPLEDLSFDSLVSTFRQLHGNWSEAAEKIRARNREYVDKLDEQYGHIRELMEGDAVEAAKRSCG